MKKSVCFALCVWSLAFNALAAPVSLFVNFSVEVCEIREDGTWCEFNLQDSLRVELDNSGEHPSLWSNSQSFDGHKFTAEIGLVRYQDGDRLIFRNTLLDRVGEEAHSQVAVKVVDWRSMGEVLIEPAEYRVDNRLYQVHLKATPASESAHVYKR